MTLYNLPPKRRRSKWRKIRTAIITLIIITIYGWIFFGIDIAWGRVFDRILKNSGIIIPQLFNPDWSVLNKVLLKIQETILIAFSGTLMASVLAVQIGLLAARYVFISYFALNFKCILYSNRSYSEIILTIIFVEDVG